MRSEGALCTKGKMKLIDGARHRLTHRLMQFSRTVIQSFPCPLNPRRTQPKSTQQKAPDGAVLLFSEEKFGGAGRSRTDLHGFAIRCITALLPRHFFGDKKGKLMLP
jgi:hypothetical protein